ncbi:polysaccharide biosynthesis tyrosine autokinase [Curtobacterium flaccumfaciens pv. flaccumfaciens]|uniref:polysaccharide biosynthesis tyrosine autokinase n=1 Tax=Curtobacterium flaccumfaciens TaxID=2035 RepID=UPI003AB5DBA1
MNYLAVIRALLSGWWIIAGATLLGAGASLVVTSVTPPTYEASTSYYVSVAGDTSATAGEIAQGSTAAQQKIKSYMQLATSPRVLQGVIDELDLDTTPAALSSQVTTSVDAGTVIIKIAVQDGSAKAAATIAEQIGKSLATVVQEIEPTGADQAPSVRLEEVTPASRPLSPIAPRKAADLALGLLGGLAAGAALALLRAAVDTRVRSSEDLDGDVPVVGDIAFDADAARHPLIIRDEVNSARSEAFRSLRTNIQFLRTSGAPTIAVTSARPSEGKTTTTANLGIALSKSGMRTVIIDADLRRPNVAAVMSLEGAVGLTDLLVGRVELDDVLQDWGLDGLSVLPAGTIPPNPSELIGSEAMARVLAELAANYDVVLVDTPPVLAVTDSALVSTLVSTTLLVTAANQTKRSDVRLAIEALARVGQQVAGIVLTKTKHKASRSAYYRSEYKSARPSDR